jgi:hypothetical protein
MSTTQTNTRHIQKMLNEAQVIAVLVNGNTGVNSISYHGKLWNREELLARAANLAAHAAQELEDERQIVLGMPVVL